MGSKTVQYFSDDYLENCKTMTSEQILSFLEQFRELHSGERKKSKLISIKIPEDLLKAFKSRAKLQGIPYQTLIKQLMLDYLKK